jgi:pimeloyl-ACP methyl ester carboxylesterase
MSQTVLFMHGGWVTPACWDPFVSFFEASGFRCLAPAWPGKDRSVEAIRSDPSPLAGLGIGEIVDHYDRIVRALDEPPILIGHSFGGLFVQVSSTAGPGLHRLDRVTSRRAHHDHARQRGSGPMNTIDERRLEQAGPEFIGDAS